MDAIFSAATTKRHEPISELVGAAPRAAHHACLAALPAGASPAASAPPAGWRTSSPSAIRRRRL